MNIFKLPIEIGNIVFSYLDMNTKINIYKCYELRKYFAPCHVKRVVISRSCIASMKTLHEELFLDLGLYIQELNLSGVPDLNASAFKPYILRLTNLKTLDITFTGIYLSDLVDLCPPNLENIGINFFKNPRKCRRNVVWETCKSLFLLKCFKKIHFVVFEFLDSDLPLLFLKESSLTEDLKITVADNYKDFWNIEDEDAPLSMLNIDFLFSKLFYLYRDCRVTHKTARCLRGVANLNFDAIEYIFIMYLEKIVIYVSPAFRSMFFGNCSDLSVEVHSYLPLDFTLDGNIVFKAWHKTVTNFDDKFYDNVLIELKDFFPCFICMHSQIKIMITKSPSNWYCIDSCNGFERILQDLPKNVTLTDFCRRDGSVCRCKRPVSLTYNSQSLSNITSLRLSNICIKEDFFTVLFNECPNLSTLDMYVEKHGRLGMFRCSTMSLSKNIHLAKKLKNIKLTSEDIEYEILFDTLSRCPTLENVHICEYERALADNEISVTNILAMIEKCKDLYSLFIEADMSPESLTLLLTPLRETAQRLCRDYLCIEVCDCYRGWNPFMDVFNPSPLHILD